MYGLFQADGRCKGYGLGRKRLRPSITWHNSRRSGGKTTKTSGRMVGYSAEIWTRHVSHTSQTRYRFRKPVLFRYSTSHFTFGHWVPTFMQQSSPVSVCLHLHSLIRSCVHFTLYSSCLYSYVKHGRWSIHEKILYLTYGKQTTVNCCYQHLCKPTET